MKWGYFYVIISVCITYRFGCAQCVFVCVVSVCLSLPFSRRLSVCISDRVPSLAASLWNFLSSFPVSFNVFIYLFIYFCFCFLLSFSYYIFLSVILYCFVSFPFPVFLYYFMLIIFIGPPIFFILHTTTIILHI